MDVRAQGRHTVRFVVTGELVIRQNAAIANAFGSGRTVSRCGAGALSRDAMERRSFLEPPSPGFVEPHRGARFAASHVRLVVSEFHGPLGNFPQRHGKFSARRRKHGESMGESLCRRWHRV